MAYTNIIDSATISTSEYSLPADTTTGVPTSQTDDCDLQAVIDFGAMAAGDEYRIRVYEKVNAGTQRVAYEAFVNGTQSQAAFYVPRFTLDEGWDLTVKKTAGTDRSIGWSLRKWTAQLNDIAANTITATAINSGAITSAKFASGAIDATAIAADAIGASELAADAVTEIVDGLLKRDLSAVTGEAARSALNALRMLRNRKSVNTGTNTVTVYKEDDSTSAFTIVYTGTDPVITDADPT